MGVVLQLRGFDEMARRIDALSRADTHTKLAASIAYRRATRIFEVSQRLVPVDLGALRASGFVSIPEIKGGRVQVTIGYGGPAAPYAWHVHEDLEAFHDDGQAKYLEVPFLAERDGYLDELKRQVADHIREQLAMRRAA